MKWLGLLLLSLGAAEQVQPKGPVIGIDLGTTYSCVGVYRDGRVQIIPNDQGNRITPSYVAFIDDQRLIGDAAKNQASLNPSNTLFDIKRFIGRNYKEKSVQDDRKLLPFAIVNKNGKAHVQVTIKGNKKTFAPEEISAMVLQKMKETAEAFLGEPVYEAVVTVPAYFTDAQRAATKDAGTISGLNVLRIINEPTAAAIAYGLDEAAKDRNILVYDLGGGTFDVSILTLDEGIFEVLATNGNTHLGGEDFDQRVMDFVLEDIKKKQKQDLSKDQRALAKIRREVEKAKRSLSSVHQTKIEIESLLKGGDDYAVTLTRAKFEELNDDLFKATLKPVARVLKDSGLSKKELHEVVLVGGSTRIPRVQQLLAKFFEGKEPHTGINPDEAVAYGAAVQGGILSGEAGDEAKGVLLLDVTPLSLGIEVIGGVFSKVIERNTVIPTKVTKVYSTTVDNQDTVATKVYQGERPMVKDNVLLGKFDLTGIPPAPKGVPQLEVTFEIDANGILKVQAADKATGNSNRISITEHSGRLKDGEIERMVREAEMYADQDKEVRGKMEVRNQLEGFVYSSKNTLKNNKRLSEIDREELEEAIGDALEWLEDAEDDDDITTADYEAKLAELQEMVGPIIGGNRQRDGDDDDDDDDADHEHEEL